MNELEKKAYTTNSINEIEELSINKDWGVRACVALNKQTPISILERLAKDQDYNVRMRIAGWSYPNGERNNNVPISLLEQLSKDSNEQVRRELAANPRTPNNILEILSSDSVNVKAAVAVNPKIPMNIVEKLKNEKEIMVVMGLTTNENVPEQIRSEIQSDMLNKY